MEKLGMEKVVAFQTRNPMHSAHEELCRMAFERLEADGILIHMLLGKLKAGDIPADVRDAAIHRMVEVYFTPGTVLITGYGFDMIICGTKGSSASCNIPPEQRLFAFDCRTGSCRSGFLLRRFRCAENFP